MAYTYSYNTGDGTVSNPGNVKVQNVVIGYYKRTGKVVAEFDIRGKDWDTSDGNLITATIRYNSTDYVTQNPKFLRPEELPYLRGDSTKIRTELGWKPTYTFKEMMEEMTDHWLDYFSKK